MLFIGTQCSNPYTSVDTPANGRVVVHLFRQLAVGSRKGCRSPTGFFPHAAQLRVQLLCQSPRGLQLGLRCVMASFARSVSYPLDQELVDIFCFCKNKKKGIIIILRTERVC